MKWIPYGPDAWLVQFADKAGDAAFASGRALASLLDRAPPLGLVEYVPSFTSLLLEFQPGACDERERRLLDARFRKAVRSRPRPSPIKEIPVHYDGPDLERVAKHTGLSIQVVCRRHAATIYKVYALGFAPGFPYLGELDRSLHTPRLPSPRPRVAAGSVAIGAQHTGIYSVESPGGWNIIGRTEVRLFDPRVDGPDAFYLRPGDRIRFVPCDPNGKQK